MKLFQKVQGVWEHFLSHFMSPILPWYQNLEKIIQAKKATNRYPLWKNMNKYLNKILANHIQKQKVYAYTLYEVYRVGKSLEKESRIVVWTRS